MVYQEVTFHNLTVFLSRQISKYGTELESQGLKDRLFPILRVLSASAPISGAAPPVCSREHSEGVEQSALDRMEPDPGTNS